MARNRYYSNCLEVFAVLLPGKPCTLNSFVHLRLSAKTIRRILKTLTQVEKYQVHTSVRERVRFWYCDLLVHKPRIFSAKRCLGPCLTVKPYEAFYKYSGSADGRQPYCKDCQHKRVRMAQKTEQGKAKRRRWYRQNRIRLNQQSKLYKERKKQEYEISSTATAVAFSRD